MLRADVVVDPQYGDCGKGKVTHHLARTKDYTHVLRYNGGCNAGHTILHKGQKFITHQIPAGVFFGIKSIIGSGCVVSPEQFFKEMKMLEPGGIDTKGKLFIAKNAHMITGQTRQKIKKRAAKSARPARATVRPIETNTAAHGASHGKSTETEALSRRSIR